TQFNAAYTKLHTTLQNVFGRRRLIAEVVRHVHSDDHAVNLRIGLVGSPRCLGQKARGRNPQKGELSDLTSRVLHDDPFQATDRVDTAERVRYTAKRLNVTPVTGYTQGKK